MNDIVLYLLVKSTYLSTPFWKQNGIFQDDMKAFDLFLFAISHNCRFCWNATFHLRFELKYNKQKPLARHVNTQNIMQKFTLKLMFGEVHLSSESNPSSVFINLFYLF